MARLHAALPSMESQDPEMAETIWTIMTFLVMDLQAPGSQAADSEVADPSTASSSDPSFNSSFIFSDSDDTSDSDFVPDESEEEESEEEESEDESEEDSDDDGSGTTISTLSAANLAVIEEKKRFVEAVRKEQDYSGAKKVLLDFLMGVGPPHIHHVSIDLVEAAESGRPFKVLPASLVGQDLGRRELDPTSRYLSRQPDELRPRRTWGSDNVWLCLRHVFSKLQKRRTCPYTILGAREVVLLSSPISTPDERSHVTVQGQDVEFTPYNEAYHTGDQWVPHQGIVIDVRQDGQLELFKYDAQKGYDDGDDDDDDEEPMVTSDDDDDDGDDKPRTPMVTNNNEQLQRDQDDFDRSLRAQKRRFYWGRFR